MRSLAPAVGVLLAAVAAAPAGAQQQPSTIVKTENVAEVGRHAYTGGTEIAFDGRFVYAGQFNGEDNRNQLPMQGGFKIFDVGKDGDELRLAGELPCPATDSDVTLVRPGLVAVAHHTGLCNPTRGEGGAPTARNNGVYLADVSNPKDVKVLGGFGVPRGASSPLSAHTVTVHPGGKVLYLNPGGLNNGGGATHIVDISDPRSPKLASTFTPDAVGCHDLQFLSDERGDFAFCAGLQKVEVWDVKDPLKPTVVTTVRNPGIQFAHNAVPSPDGKLLVINDEAFAGHDCTGPGRVYGSLWVYNIEDPRNPVLAGRVAPPNGANPAGYSAGDLAGIDGRPIGPASGWTRSWCAAHNYNFVPGTRILVAGWFTGGVTVEDLTDPSKPVRTASWRASRSIVYTAHYHAGRIYVNDLYRGMDVLEVDGLRDAEQGGGKGRSAIERRGARLRAAMPGSTGALPAPAQRPARMALRIASFEDSAFCVLPKAALPRLRASAAQE